MPTVPDEPTVPDRPRPDVVRPPSMADVAAVAGVSHQTVSRVLNNHPSVRAETRMRVQDAVKRLGYRPNTAARALVTRRSRTIGVIGVASAVFGQTRALIAMEQRARPEGWFLSIALVLDWTKESVLRALEHVLDQGVEAVVFMGSGDHLVDAVREVKPGVPVVMTGGQVACDDVLWTSVDHVRGERLALEHLAGLGHRRILHVHGPERWSMFQDRHRAYQEFMREAGWEPWSIESGAYLDDGFRLGNQLLGERELPTAVVAANDQTAFGLARALGKAGVRVPDDVSLVGYDDAYGSDYAMPALTTVRQEFAEVGANAVDLVLAATSGHRPAPVVVEPRLIVRESTAAPREPRD